MESQQSYAAVQLFQKVMWSKTLNVYVQSARNTTGVRPEMRAGWVGASCTAGAGGEMAQHAFRSKQSVTKIVFSVQILFKNQNCSPANYFLMYCKTYNVLHVAVKCLFFWTVRSLQQKLSIQNTYVVFNTNGPKQILLTNTFSSNTVVVVNFFCSMALA